MKVIKFVLLALVIGIVLVMAVCASSNSASRREPFPHVVEMDGFVGYEHPELPADSLFFAEGCLEFDNYLLLYNPDDTVQRSKIVYFVNGGDRYYSNDFYLPARTRYTMEINLCPLYISSPDLSFAVITDDDTLYVERSMYWTNGSGGRVGHNNTPQTPKTIHYFAEGCTDYGFETFLTLLNPNEQAVSVHITALGLSDAIDVGIDPYSRKTFNLNDFSDGDVSALVESDLPIVVERVMFTEGRASGYVNGGQ